MSYKVCIPTAGIGSRLGSHTQFINKSLVTVANKPVISHIIEKFPAEVEFVVALGYKGQLVRDFLELAYPNKKFYFCDVSPYEGPGSGLGLSLISCKDYLKEPFVFISCDTLVGEDIHSPSHNWVGYASVDDISKYRTVMVKDDQVAAVLEKGESGEYLKAYIGLAGIFNFNEFWESMLAGGETAVNNGEAYGLRHILHEGINGYQFTWYDTGNIPALEKAREVLKRPDAPNILDKPNEAIWFVGENVIKFSDDDKFIKNRVERLQYLGGYVPEVIGQKQKMYMYKKVEGKVLSSVATLPLFKKLLDSASKFWGDRGISEGDYGEFKEKCDKFYKDKSHERIQLFYDRKGRKDGNENINDEETKTLSDYLFMIDWEWMASGSPGRFHGDFHFENILWSKEDDKFIYLDWRQDFGGRLDVGDMYYDLAKLLHGLIISHELIAADQYWIDWGEADIRYDFHRKQVLVDCELYFYEWLKKMGYDLKKVKILTALIYLNIAALHHDPYSFLLYALGKSMLKRELEA